MGFGGGALHDAAEDELLEEADAEEQDEGGEEQSIPGVDEGVGFGL